MKVCGKVGIVIVVIIMEGGKLDRVGKGGGRKEVDSGEVEEEESNTTTGVGG